MSFDQRYILRQAPTSEVGTFYFGNAPAIHPPYT